MYRKSYPWTLFALLIAYICINSWKEESTVALFTFSVKETQESQSNENQETAGLKDWVSCAWRCLALIFSKRAAGSPLTTFANLYLRHSKRHSRRDLKRKQEDFHVCLSLDPCQSFCRNLLESIDHKWLDEKNQFLCHVYCSNIAIDSGLSSILPPIPVSDAILREEWYPYINRRINTEKRNPIENPRAKSKC